MSLWHFKKEVRNEVRDLTALAGSITTLTIYYTYNVLPPLTLIYSQYGIHSKPFLRFINGLCNINSLLFQVTLGPCKLACYACSQLNCWFFEKKFQQKKFGRSLWLLYGTKYPKQTFLDMCFSGTWVKHIFA